MRVGHSDETKGRRCFSFLVEVDRLSTKDLTSMTNESMND